MLCTVPLALAPASLPLPARSPAPAPPAKLGSKVFVWDDLKVVPTATGVRRDVVVLPTATFAKFESHITTLNPGKSAHPPHHHAREEFSTIAEGSLDAHLTGRVERVGPGSLRFVASNEPADRHVRQPRVPVTTLTRTASPTRKSSSSTRAAWRGRSTASRSAAAPV